MQMILFAGIVPENKFISALTGFKNKKAQKFNFA